MNSGGGILTEKNNDLLCQETNLGNMQLYFGLLDSEGGLLK